MKIISKIELLLIGIWLGAACFFSFAVAPSAFAVLPSSALAGNVVNRTLTILNFSGMIVGIILIALSFIPRVEIKKLWSWAQRILLLLLTLACGGGQLIIGLFLENLRKLSETPISELASDSPIKLRFDMWHQYSVWILLAGMVSALLAFFVISRKYSSAAVTTQDVAIPEFELPDDLKM